MADMLNDGNIKVTYVPTIADISAPTASELSAGTDLECLITSFDPTVNEQAISVKKLCQITNSEKPGTVTYQFQMTMVRKETSSEDVGWTTLLRNTEGYLVVRYGVPYDTAYAAGDDVQVYPGASGARRPQPPEANSPTTFISQWYVSEDPDLDAVVA